MKASPQGSSSKAAEGVAFLWLFRKQPACPVPGSERAGVRALPVNLAPPAERPRASGKRSASCGLPGRQLAVVDRPWVRPGVRPGVGQWTPPPLLQAAGDPELVISFAVADPCG